MTQRRTPPPGVTPPFDVPALLESWLVHLAAERKSKQTLKSYGDGVRAFTAWCDAHHRPPLLNRPTVNAWTADLLDNGAEAATVRSRQLAVRRFSAWLDDEGEIDHDELLTLKPPKLDVKVIDPLSDDELRALLGACDGKTFLDRRDTALLRMMLETTARASEMVGMTVSGTDIRNGTVLIRRGKGGKGRTAPFSPHCGRAVDRYLRARRTHRLADTDALWLGDRGKEFGYYGLHSALKSRAEQAGIEHFHPHRMRHTAATRWLTAGGSEGGLMAIAGWSRRDMLDRYTAATSAARAADEARHLGLGDL